MSAADVIAYKDGITGSHFGVGGIDLIMIPLHVSSLIIAALRLSTAAFRVLTSQEFNMILDLSTFDK
jgi:hypothetical protein